ncbi:MULTISPECIES: tyrosine-type recombinase/integrase [unclassified Streptomyces]|uniref:tyrosine-type recombinase/integrase n=1 Tax=unclassified Streptomyces TaxID=2593676 RepID=UPI00364C20E8
MLGGSSAGWCALARCRARRKTRRETPDPKESGSPAESRAGAGKHETRGRRQSCTRERKLRGTVTQLRPARRPPPDTCDTTARGEHGRLHGLVNKTSPQDRHRRNRKSGHCHRSLGTGTRTQYNTPHAAQQNGPAPCSAATLGLHCQKRTILRPAWQAARSGESSQVRGKGRKGWLPAFRDAALFKTAYAYGLRRNETRMLDLTDFGRNPKGREFGEYGTLQVRYGKAKRGSPPKRRSVLTVWRWTPETVDEWISEVRPPGLRHATGPALWPSERGPRVGVQRLDSRFAAYRDAVGLDPALKFHALRRSYITHLIEAGFDPLFVQHQVGHDHASTTAIYTCVSSDFRTRTLRRVLDATVEAALRPGRIS